MNIIYTLLLFLALLLLCEIMAILLKLTGLDMEKARFQVISIITHTGFTTRESELIAQHPLRRKIVSYLMLFSYIAQATFFTVLISSIKDNGILNLLIIIGSIILIIIFILQNSSLLKKLEPIIAKFISKTWMKSVNNRGIEKILLIDDDYEVIELIVNVQNPLCNIYLKELGIEFVKILMIDKGEKIIATPKGNDLIEEGDRIVVYGRVDKLKELSL